MIEVRESEVDGLGVFSKEYISKGTIIEVCPFIVLEQPFMLLDNKLKEYVFSFDNKCSIVFGNGSMYNHSDDNNVNWLFNPKQCIFYANRNIMKGEELFICYGEEYKKNVKTI